jgi:hypothetical protein
MCMHEQDGVHESYVIGLASTETLAVAADSLGAYCRRNLVAWIRGERIRCTGTREIGTYWEKDGVGGTSSFHATRVDGCSLYHRVQTIGRIIRGTLR